MFYTAGAELNNSSAKEKSNEDLWKERQQLLGLLTVCLHDLHHRKKKGSELKHEAASCFNSPPFFFLLTIHMHAYPMMFNI